MNLCLVDLGFPYAEMPLVVKCRIIQLRKQSYFNTMQNLLLPSHQRMRNRCFVVQFPLINWVRTFWNDVEHSWIYFTPSNVPRLPCAFLVVFLIKMELVNIAYDCSIYKGKKQRLSIFFLSPHKSVIFEIVNNDPVLWVGI